MEQYARTLREIAEVLGRDGYSSVAANLRQISRHIDKGGRMIRPTDDEVQDQISEAEAENGRWPGMTYEKGVSAALRWAVGESDEKPISE